MRWRVVPVLVAASALTLSGQTPSYDLVLRHARVVDGTGSPWYRADIAIAGDTIAAIAPSIEAGASRVIDVGGDVVAPGFIDIHTHARRGIDQVPTAPNYIRQGVTTVMEGPDGSSPVPLAPFLAQLDALPKSINIGSFIGQGSVRSAIIGNVDRAATPDEIRKMEALVEQGMTDGAFGLSTGLFYVPGTFTPTAEVIQLARVAGRYGGMHESHQRDDASKIIDSVKETIAIGEGGGLPTQISHHKVVGTANWGRSVDTLRLVDEARARGVDVTIDQYPYTASSTSVAAALLPAWALEGNREAQLARLRDPATRARIKAGGVAMIRDERGGGDPKNVQFANCGFDASLAGKTLADLTRQRGLEPTIDNAAETTMWLVEQGGCQGIFHAMSEEDLVRILEHPATMIASDGEIPIFGRANPHPRSYGTFARVLGVYVRERRVLTLEDAIRKMTAFPAARLRLTDRGIVRPGMKADLAIFDPARVRDTATYTEPHQYAEGFTHVIVNGQVVFENGAMTAARPGKVLYGPGFRK
ncbi:MAG TPA: D-aminoacylase [Vicinamibacterales bacterium]|nr:D-aminoacylase [Vicinamibacterales bacterium]